MTTNYAIPSAEIKIRDNVYYLRVVEKDDNSKPFTVMAFSYDTGLDQQVSSWYVYRGNAKRWLRNRLAQGDLTILCYTN